MWGWLHQSQSRKLDQTFRIGYQQSPPYQILTSDLQPSGVGIDILKQAATNLGLELEWVYCPQSPDHHFAHDDVDLWPIVTDLPHRRTQFFITKPIYHNSIGMLTREASAIQLPIDTQGKRVAFYDREPGITLALKLFPQAQLIPMPGNAETIHAVFEDQADAALLWSTKENALTFKQAIEEHPDIPFRFFHFDNSKITCGIAASFSTPGAKLAATRLREEVRRMATTGAVQEIYFKYYLDPENEISSYFYVYDLERRNLLLRISLLALLLGIGVLTFMAVQLRRSRKEAYVAAETKGAFLANMSHEIRTPLNGVLTMTELALTTQLTPEQRALLQTAHESADLLLTIVNDILAVATIEARQLPIERSAVPLRELLESSTRFFKIQAQEKQLGLNWECDESLPAHLMEDPIRLRQILFNLLSNAVKYTESGHIIVRATASDGGNPDQWELIVEDTGIGIPADKVETIFDAFVQADLSHSRRHGGTGLGLTICRHLATLMNGTITVTSHEGNGSSFRVSLPLVPADPPLETITGESRCAAEDLQRIPNLRSLQVLVVDDNPLNLKIAATVLERNQHGVTLAKNGFEAIEILKTHDLDVVLMDLQMPEMDGYETTRRIREMESQKGSRIPIIALTACVMNNERERSLECGMDGFLSKPLKVAYLLKAIRALPIAAQIRTDTPGA